MDGFVYMLFEHKSYPDKFVAVQLLRYMGAIWDQWLKGQKGETTARLPVIIPIVFYHGAETWIPLKLCNLVANSAEALCSYVPSFDFLLSDFSTKSESDIRGANLLQAVLRLLHSVPGGDLHKELDAIMFLLKGEVSDVTGEQIFRLIIRYIFNAVENVGIDEVIQCFRKLYFLRNG